MAGTCGSGGGEPELTARQQPGFVEATVPPSAEMGSKQEGQALEGNALVISRNQLEKQDGSRKFPQKPQ